MECGPFNNMQICFVNWSLTQRAVYSSLTHKVALWTFLMEKYKVRQLCFPSDTGNQAKGSALRLEFRFLPKNIKIASNRRCKKYYIKELLMKFTFIY